MGVLGRGGARSEEFPVSRGVQTGGKGGGVVASGAPERGGTGLKLGLEGSKMQEVKPA